MIREKQDRNLWDELRRMEPELAKYMAPPAEWPAIERRSVQRRPVREDWMWAWLWALSVLVAFLMGWGGI